MKCKELEVRGEWIIEISELHKSSILVARKTTGHFRSVGAE